MIQQGEKPPFLPLALATPRIRRIDRSDGSFILHSEESLSDYPGHMALVLRAQAEARPDTVFLAQRQPDGGWRRVTYAQAWSAARSIAQALLDRGYGDQSDATAMIAAKNHKNGAKNPLAHMQKDFGYEFCKTVSDKNPLEQYR